MIYKLPTEPRVIQVSKIFGVLSVTSLNVRLNAVVRLENTVKPWLGINMNGFIYGLFKSITGNQ